MQRLVLDSGVRPTLTTSPQETFDSSISEAAAGARPNAIASSPVAAEVFASTPQPNHSATPQPWNAADALLQLKLALDDAPRLRDMHADMSCSASAAAPSTTPPQAASAPVFCPPLLRCSSTTTTTTRASSLFSAYAQQALWRIQEACAEVEALLLPLPSSAHERTGMGSAAVTADLPWAITMEALQEPELVAVLQRRADAAVWERECAFRLGELVTAELRRRNVPVELAQHGLDDFARHLDECRALLDDYLYVHQPTVDTLAPMLEAAAVRARTVAVAAQQSSPAVTERLDDMERWAAALAAQVKADSALLQRNVDALMSRLRACQAATAPGAA